MSAAEKMGSCFAAAGSSPRRLFDLPSWVPGEARSVVLPAAVLFSIIASCQRHHVDPFAYLRDVLTHIAAHPACCLAELLPDRWHPSA